MEFSIRILVAIILTIICMHALTLFLILFHKEKLCSHAAKVKSFILPEPRHTTPLKSTVKPVNDIQMKVHDFDDMFGIVTGIEAMDESYSIHAQN